jgi:hypothetical protein
MSDRNLCQERRTSGERRKTLLGSKLFEPEFRTMSGRNLWQKRRANSEEPEVLLGGKLFEIISSSACGVAGSSDARLCTALLVSARVSRLFHHPRLH